MKRGESIYITDDMIKSIAAAAGGGAEGFSEIEKREIIRRERELTKGEGERRSIDEEDSFGLLYLVNIIIIMKESMISYLTIFIYMECAQSTFLRAHVPICKTSSLY